MERPGTLRDLPSYVFWTEQAGAQRTLGLPAPNPATDGAYYQALDDLARQIFVTLHILKAASAAIPADTSVLPPVESLSAREQAMIESGGTFSMPDAGPIVFLAEATDDLTPQRDRLKRYINQHGGRILPIGLWIKLTI